MPEWLASCLNVLLALNEAANLLVFSGKRCARHKFTYSVQYIILDHFGPGVANQPYPICTTF